MKSNGENFVMGLEKGKKVVIINTRSGAVKKKYFKKIGILGTTFGFRCYPTNSLGELKVVAHEISENEPEIIAIFGGDGTLYHTINILQRVMDELPPFIFMPGGTFNTVARNLGYRDNPFEILKKLESGYDKKDVPLLRIRVDKEDENFGFIFATGLPFKSFEQYYSGGEPTLWTGVKTALWPLASFLFPFLFKENNYFDAPDMEVKIDNKFLWEGPTLAVAASTVPNLGLWISPFSEEGEGFYTLASSVPIGEIMKSFFKVLRGNFSHPLHYNRRSKKVVLSLSSGYLVEGEMFPLNERHTIEISEGPIIRIILPRG